MPDKKRPVSTGSDKKPKRSKTEESLVYDPVHFIRSHSKNNDPADVQTQIWEVVFEPDPEDNSKTLSNVATCGGNSICIIDVNSGTVLMKYKHKDIRENFYTLAWTTLNLGGEKTNILASGGIKGEIRMFHPKNKVCFHEWKPVDIKKPTAVNSLVFHSSEPTWLFVGTNDGNVSLFDVGTPTLPTYDGVNPRQLLKLFPDYGDVYNIAWSGHNSKWLLAGTAAGLVGWKIEAEKVRSETKYKPFLVDFLLPASERDKDENPIVDSLAIVSEYTVVAKCANHGLIYLWDLRATTKDLSAKDAVIAMDKEVSMLANLKWSDTDNFYMNLGCHKGKGLIVCGDDKGSLWLYNMPGMVNSSPDKSPEPIKKLVDPTTKLVWPELQDDHLENSRKVPLDRHDIIIDKVTTSWDCSHIVAVTSNNMVCIWKRTDEDSSDS